VLAFSGDNIVTDRPGQPHPFKDAAVNSLPEIYNPKTNSWTDLTSATLTSPLYPRMFTLSNGKVFDVGPDTVTRTLDPTTGTWTTVGTSPFDGMSAVMYRPDKIMKAGTWADPDFYGGTAPLYTADGQTAVIDMSAPSPAWRSTAPMAYGRSYQNLTLLPDGTVLASGGMSTSDGTDLSKAVLPSEIWNPDTETWTTVASLTNGREYHSTALLLPDGRVLMAGGGALPGRATDQLNAEIYSPPYLFKGARPTIGSAPAGAAYGSSFDVTTPDAASITKVSLIRTASVTHSFDMNQRFQFLNFTTASGKITVQAPTASLAPPGDYILFLLNRNGVPSGGSIIRLSSTSDVTPPSAPTNLTATASSGQVVLSWDASSDPSGIANYDLYRSTTSGFTPSAANRIAQPTGLTSTDSGLAAGTYYYKVAAEDNAGNLSGASSEASAVVTSAAASGLVAAYAFDEGSGTTTADRSGNANNGTLSNATWAGATAGKFGNALSFNGSNARVDVNDSNSLDLTSGMTIEAWVKPSLANSSFQTALLKEQTGQLVYALYSNTNTAHPDSEAAIGGSNKTVAGASALPVGTWSYLSATYDGSTLRLYLNGTQVSQLATSGSLTTSSGALRIGGNAVWGEYFSGLIDEVRVYNRALSAAEIGQDMTTPISPTDTQAPTAPNNLSATGALSSVSLSWGASSDNVGVTRYDVYRSTTSGFTPSVANRIAQPAGTSYSDSSLAAGTYYYKVQAEDAAGNLSPASNEASAVVGDTSPPTVPGTLSATGAIGKATLGWGAASDNVGITRYDLYRSATSGFTPSTANRIAQPSGTSYVDTAAPGTYYYRVAAEDAAGNVGPAGNEASATVLADTTAPTAPSNLSASVAGGTVTLGWTGSTDDVAVTRYDVYRGTSPGFTPTVANRIAQPSGTNYSDSGLALGSYYYKVQAEDAAGNLSGSSNEVSASVADSSPPTAPSGVTTTVVGTTVNVSWTGSSDNAGVLRYNLYRGTSAGFTPAVANRIAQPVSTLYSDIGLTAGSYYYKLTAEDTAGNVSGLSNEVSATIAGAAPPGLVASYGFNAGSGTSAADSSGNANTGTLSNATWAGAAAGKYGNALSFNGTNARVNVSDSNSLDLTSGMTLEGWVKPNVVTSYRTLVVKERPGDLAYGLYANVAANRPEAQVAAGGQRVLAGTSAIPANTWTHLAATYDGSTLRIYVNGTQVSSLAATGTITTSTSPLRIGGNAIWSEWFNGLIDEVRVYNRALSAAEIGQDMTTPITP
jgi:hypothetical protein